jgi:hypothetical protein
MTELFPPSLDDMIKCVEREILFRQVVYPRRIASNSDDPREGGARDRDDARGQGDAGGPETMSRVYLAQCLCPQRHAILAASGEAMDQIEAEAEVLALLKGGDRALRGDGRDRARMRPVRREQ